ncbi:MAG: class I SAM-dependent methyltransferase [Bacilli bacterium]|nr:class I SAM-dependent methyltransferase [Bacilli bacterium]
MSYYFSNDENIKMKKKDHQVNIAGLSFVFTTDNGVFSKRGLDFGTRTLLESLPEYIKGEVLDFGCGYGPIGIFLKKKYFCKVDMVDINKRSISLALENALKNNVEVNIFESNIYENIKKEYDFIITNPPIRVGKEILYKVLMDAYDYLKEKGELWLVIHKDQGAKTTIRDLNKKYNAELITKNKGFCVICARKR